MYKRVDWTSGKHGLFLMIEGGAIDWASHANQSGRTIEEEVDFNHAVEAVIDWVNRNSDWSRTLLIVTGDHETGYLTGPGSGPGTPPVWSPIVNNGAGILPGMEWHSGNHTNQLIPFYAQGDAASLFTGYTEEYDPIRGLFINNTEIAQSLRILWDEETIRAAEVENDLPITADARLVINASANPFRGSVQLSYEMAAAGPVHLSIYDASGRKVRTLVNGVEPAGTHKAAWSASDVPSGVYFARLQTGKVVAVRKLNVID